MSTALIYGQQQLEQRRRQLPKRPAAIGQHITRTAEQPANGLPVNGRVKAPAAATPPDTAVEPVRLDALDLQWHPKVATAVSAARAWQQRRRAQIAAGETPNASLVLLATGRGDDPNVTGYGCGKTHIARACLWTIIRHIDDEPMGPVGKLFVAESLLHNLNGETRVTDEIGFDCQWVDREFVRRPTPILVIDDVGTEGVIPFVKQDPVTQAAERHARYFKALNYCYEAGVSVIITANLTVPGLADHIGGRAWSRLQEMAPAGFIVDLSGVPDYRRKLGGR